MRRPSLPGRRRAPADAADGARFGRGVVSAVDLLAPASAEVHPGWLQVEDACARTLAVVGYPRYVHAGWLGPLLELDEPLVLSQHLFPLASRSVVGALSRTLVQLQSSRLMDARGGRIADAEREVAYADVERLRDQLQRGEERVFAVGVYATLRAPTLAALDGLSRRVESVLGGLMAQSRRCLLQQPAGFRSTVPWGRDHLLVTRNLDTSSVATLFPFSSADLSTEQGVLLGVALQGGTPIVLDPFADALDNASLAVFAKSGAGKSYAVKLLLLRSLLLGREAVVVDPEGEYAALCRELGEDGQEVRLGAASPHVLNPFDLSPRPEGVDPLAEKVVGLLALLGIMLGEPGRPLGRAEAGALDRAIHATYAAAGITRDPATHGRRPPTLRDLHAGLRAQGDGYGLADRLERYASGSLRQLFGGQTNVDLDRRLVAFNLRDLEAELRPLATSLVADCVWTRSRTARQRRPRLFVVDEAWSLVRHADGAAFLAELAKRGRKYWLGLVTVTQDVEDFLASPQGRAVVANASVHLLMKQDASSIGAVARAFRLTEGEQRELLTARRGDGLLCALGTRVALRVEASPREDALITTRPAQLAAREHGADGAAEARP